MWIMELKDKQRSLVNRTPGKENAYENTELNRSGLSLIHVEENEYEVLRRSTGSRSDHTGSEKAPFNPSKRLIYVLVGLVVFLYLAAAAVAVVLIMPKGGEPINGAWSNWESWGSCSAACDFGMERRERSCTDPEPSTSGKDCSGEPLEYRLCNKRPCAAVHGNWSDWSSWGSCSAICDFGMESRERSCTQPKPGVGGDYCAGEPAEYRTCKISSCRVDWSQWSSWSSCSLSCGGGIQYRSRLCMNPSDYGQFCIGAPVQLQSCNRSRCPPAVSSFVVDHPQNLTNSRLTFSRTVFHQGSDFNASTGKFTCSIPGTYLFSVNLPKKRSSTRVDSISCSLYKYLNSYWYSEAIAQVYVNPTDDDTDKGSAAVSSTVVTSLKLGDFVYLYGCTDPVTTMDYRSTFTGVLLYPD